MLSASSSPCPNCGADTSSQNPAPIESKLRQMLRFSIVLVITLLIAEGVVTVLVVKLLKR